MDPVDISPFTLDLGNLEEQQRRSEELVAALSAIGFVYIVGHNIPDSVLESAFANSREFFLMDTEMKYAAISKDRARRGYSPCGSENFSSLIGRHQVNDTVEKFRVGPLRAAGIHCHTHLYM